MSNTIRNNNDIYCYNCKRVYPQIKEVAAGLCLNCSTVRIEELREKLGFSNAEIKRLRETIQQPIEENKMREHCFYRFYSPEGGGLRVTPYLCRKDLIEATKNRCSVCVKYKSEADNITKATSTPKMTAEIERLKGVNANLLEIAKEAKVATLLTLAERETELCSTSGPTVHVLKQIINAKKEYLQQIQAAISAASEVEGK